MLWGQTIAPIRYIYLLVASIIHLDIGFMSLTHEFNMSQPNENQAIALPIDAYCVNGSCCALSAL